MLRLIIVIFIVLVGSLIFYNYRNDEVKTEKTVVAIQAPPHVKVAPAITLSANPHWIELLNDYKSYIKSAIENGEAPGAAVAIVKDSSVLFLNGFGLSD